MRFQSNCSCYNLPAVSAGRIIQNMSPGQIPPGHMLVHFVISHHSIAFSQVSLLRLSLQPPPSPLHCFIFPSPRLRRIPYSIVRSCGLTVVFSLHVNPQVRTVCGMPLWALCCCQPVAVSELGSWWLLGTGGTLYESVWGLLVEQWDSRPLHIVLV